jgi:hypothetical protein
MTILTDYIVHKVIEDVRAGVKFNEDLCEALNTVPLIDSLRMVVEPSDIDKLLALAESPSTIIIGSFALSLLQRYATEERVKTFLQRAWVKADSYSRKLPLMFRLLDDAELDDATRNEMHSFVNRNLEQFLTDVAGWYGGKENVLECCRSRLMAFPPSKAWVYLISATASPETRYVSELLSEYLSSGDNLTAQVAREMLNRITP